MFKQKSDSPAGSSQAESTDAVQAARTRARHRLIGAIVLLVIGVIGFPLVFETQPRPIPVDIPIEIPRRDAMPPLAMPSAPSAATASPIPAEKISRPATDVITESRDDAGRDVTPLVPPSATAPAIAPVPSPVSVPAPTAAARPASKPAAATTPKPSAEGERAQALLEGRPMAAAATAPPAAPASPAEGARFVLQVGAFADAESARESRKQVEKLGLKTYTQVAQTPGGNRIRVRVGPFASRADADAALAKVKSAGHTGVVLTL